MGRILIVEDEVDTAKMIEKRILSAGFKTAVVGDTYSATAFLRKEKPALVILDLMLPGGGGMTVLKNMRAFSARKKVPVLVLTAMKDEEYIKNLETIGIKAFLRKPYDPEVLIDMIRGLVDMGEEE
jgi:DNA-binding response OmpR family regulator